MKSHKLRLRLLLLLGLAPFLVSGSEPPPAYLLLSLDGVGQVHAALARERGYLSAFQPPIPVVSTFPSLTNVGFTGMTRPIGLEEAPGYENRYYDWAQNRVHGAIPYIHFPWHRYFDVDHNSVFHKALGYFWPLKMSRHDLRAVFQERLESDSRVMKAYVANPDALAHMRGVQPTVDLLHTLDQETRQLKKDFMARTGRVLHVLVFSDHGQTPIQQRAVRGFKKHLEKGGFRLENSLRDDQSVAIARFGYVEAGMLFCRPNVRDRLARWVVRLEGMEMCAYAQDDGHSVVIVSSDGGEALIDSREGALRYRALTGDPLRHADIEKRLREQKKLDEEGFAPAQEWLLESAGGDYPDALYRIHAAFFGPDVQNKASVIFTTKEGRAFGHPLTRKLSWLRGGKLEATHGSLRRDPSLALLLNDDPDLKLPPVFRYDQLLPFLEKL